MEKLIFTFIFFWVIWKVLKRGIDELQSRMDEQKKQQEKQAPQRRPASAAARRPVRREPARLESGPRMPAKEGAELERLLMEAMKRKDQLDDADEAIPLIMTEEKPPEPVHPRATQPRAQQPRVIYRETTVTRRVEPQTDHRREVRVERRRGVAVPREPAASAPEQQLMRISPPLARRGVERPRRRMARGRTSAIELAGIGRLGKRSIRKGIIMAEILGAPKALRDIDSHVI